jgi:hypothetical protein
MRRDVPRSGVTAFASRANVSMVVIDLPQDPASEGGSLPVSRVPFSDPTPI